MVNTYDKVRLELVAQSIHYKINDKIYDLGGGQHNFKHIYLPSNYSIVDGDESLNPDIVCDLNESLPIESNSADIVIAGEIIEHIINPFRFLLEVKRILKSSGRLLLTVPNIASLKNRVLLLFGMMPCNAAQSYPTTEDHLFYHKTDWTLDRIKLLLETAGFKINEVKTDGIFFRNKQIIKTTHCPTKLGEKFIISATKL